ncbi:MAG: NUDIX domain-containing protein [Erysipelotrichaceae bacterium]|nr:NUDIX domain-containing protein [Erysipelotrichaceae bacterium]
MYERSCGAVVFTRENGIVKYVIVRQKGGIWGFPKGHSKKFESQKQTALREVQEEVGLTPEIIPGFQEQEMYNTQHGKHSVNKKVIYFLAYYQDQPIVMQKDELSKARLADYEEAMSLMGFDSKKRILTAADSFIREMEKQQ